MSDSKVGFLCIAIGRLPAHSSHEFARSTSGTAHQDFDSPKSQRRAESYFMYKPKSCYFAWFAFWLLAANSSFAQTAPSAPQGPATPAIFSTTTLPGYDDRLARYIPLPPIDSAAADATATNGDSEGSTEEEPGDIRDNAFLVEEAFNQEPGVVQHIFNWINLWDSIPDEGRTRQFAATYTMELPLGSQKHQFSFTTQYLTNFEQPIGGPATQQGDIGDTFLNYRYQLLANDDFLWCAPRFTLILPTGDKRWGLGLGELGYQFNLPISRYGKRFDFHFNAGATLIPNVSLPLGGGSSSQPQDIRGYNLGASAFWKPQTYLHFFVEGLALWNEEIDDLGFRNGLSQVFVNPGVRYAICQFDEIEWVIGVAAPIGLTPDSPDIGVFAYMSVEHIFRRTKNEGADR